MKTIILKSLSAALVVVGLVACSDFLDQKSSSSLDSNNIYSSYELAKGTISNIYQQFGQMNYRARSIWYGYNTDIEYYSGSDKGDGKANLATYAALPTT